MGLKKRNKINAQFNMSSLTDIIFLLLIFFMLTSSLIVPNALNLKLPGQSNSTTTISTRPDEVRISANGTYYFNGSQVSRSALSSALRGVRNEKGADGAVIVTADGNAPNQYVVTVLDMVRLARLAAILNEAG
jgi:biopolymer transport protein ExbD